MDRSKSHKTKEFYEFGGFSLEVEKRRLWRDEELISLTPKEFDVLFYLVKRSGQVAEKDELLDAIWTDTFVEETTLARNVSWLRKKLGAGANGGKFIETVPKRGYRFTAEVTRRQAEIAPLENADALDFEDKLLIEDDALIVEEESVRHLSIERTITLTPESPSEVSNSKFQVPSRRKFQLPSSKDKGQRTKDKALLVILAFVALAGIAFTVYQIYFQNNRPNVVVASSVVPFSGATGRENTMVFSPDGKQIAYSWNGGEGNTLDLYVRLLDGAGEPVRLTETDITEQYPTFSPDGSQIAFMREFKDHGEIVLIPALGGAERRVARLFSGNYSISFSPDGKNIAVIDTENSTDGGQYAVYLVNIETGERRRVTAPAEFAGETTPRFSPDGKSLAFVRISTDQKQDLFVVPTSGGEPRQITFDEKVIHSLTWSASGQEIYFVSYRGSNQASIWRIPAAGGTPEIISTGGKDITNIAASSNGKTIAFVENTFNADIWRTTANSPTATKLIASTYNEHAPQFSPDDSRIIFVSDHSKKLQIWTADANGKNQRQLSDTPHNAGSPHFSPDGSRIAFHIKDGEAATIFTMSAEGGAAQPLTLDASQNILPAWSADGKYIYFTSNRTGENNLWKIPASGGEAVQITKNGAFRAEPAPDGKTIFYSKTDASNGLWRVPAEGGVEESVHELADIPANKWLMSRQGIYFLVRQSDESFKINFYDFAAGKVKESGGDYKIPPNVQGSPGANADGTVFLYSMLDQNASRIMLAELE